MQAAPVVVALDEFLDPLGQMLPITVVLRKNLVVLGFRLLFTPVVRQNYFVSRINRLAWAGFTVKSAGTWSLRTTQAHERKIEKQLRGAS